jgi:hypothetical protein
MRQFAPYSLISIRKLLPGPFSGLKFGDLEKFK